MVPLFFVSPVALRFQKSAESQQRKGASPFEQQNGKSPYTHLWMSWTANGPPNNKVKGFCGLLFPSSRAAVNGVLQNNSRCNNYFRASCPLQLCRGALWYSVHSGDSELLAAVLKDPSQCAHSRNFSPALILMELKIAICYSTRLIAYNSLLHTSVCSRLSQSQNSGTHCHPNWLSDALFKSKTPPVVCVVVLESTAVWFSVTLTSTWVQQDAELLIIAVMARWCPTPRTTRVLQRMRWRRRTRRDMKNMPFTAVRCSACQMVHSWRTFTMESSRWNPCLLE